MLEGMVDNFHGSQRGQLLEHIDQRFERHIVDHGDVLLINEGLPYSHCRGYMTVFVFVAIYMTSLHFSAMLWRF
jgi:hypothetical protein